MMSLIELFLRQIDLTHEIVKPQAYQRWTMKVVLSAMSTTTGRQLDGAASIQD